ncbi:MAG TPA: hypothetical protein VFQ61_00790 [Polyangiaceae bacterium]|nr:hypothetical protein [Polyangiaceae bacterium]
MPRRSWAARRPFPCQECRAEQSLSEKPTAAANPDARATSARRMGTRARPILAIFSPISCALGWLGVLGAVGALACSEAAPQGFAPYAGDAYPNRRARFEANGHTLGYVANRFSDSITVLDLDTMQTLGTAPVGRDPADTDGPRHILLDEPHGLAYVALTYPLEVRSPHVVMEGAPERASYVQALALDDLRVMGEVRLDTSADEMAFSPAAGSLVVSHRDPLKGLSLTPTPLVWIDEPWRMSDNTVTQRRLSPCVAPGSLAWDRSSALVYVACTGEDKLGVIDAQTTPRVLEFVASGMDVVNQPYAVVADESGPRLLVSNQVAQKVAVFEVGSGPDSGSTQSAARQIGSITVSGVPGFSAFLGREALIIPQRDPAGVLRVDAQSLEIQATSQLSSTDCENPSEARATEDGRLFLVCEGDHYSPGAVLKLDPNTLATEAKVNVGLYPDRLAVRPFSR